jgi:hypothetical protein
MDGLGGCEWPVSAALPGMDIAGPTGVWMGFDRVPAGNRTERKLIG